MLDSLTEWIGEIMATIIAAAGVMFGRNLVAKDRAQDERIADHETRIALAENNHGQITGLLSDIRDEVKGMRADGRDRQRQLYEHIEGLRKEMKQDLAGKVDK